MVSIPGLETLNIAGAVQGTINSLVYWGEVFFIAGAILAALIMVFYFYSYPIKATVFKCYGSGKDGMFAISKPKLQRFKWTKKRTAWKAMLPIAKGKEVEPFDDEFVYPGNRVYAYELNNEYIPIRISFVPEEKRGEMCPVPYHMMNWHLAKLKENEQLFADPDWWTNNKHMVTTVACVLFCCIMCGFCVWLSFK